MMTPRCRPLHQPQEVHLPHQYGGISWIYSVPRRIMHGPSESLDDPSMAGVDGETCSAVHYQPKQPKTLPVLNQGGAGYETEADLWYQAQQAADTLPNTQTGRRHPNWSQAPKLQNQTQ